VVTSYTRSGPGRQGNAYQDAWSLQILLDWLEHPDKYAWVTLEADDAGALDDITAELCAGGLIYRQIKFAVHPASERLTLTRFAKWLSSWQQSLEQLQAFGRPIHEATLYTNRLPGKDLVPALDDGRIVPDDLTAEVRERLFSTLRDEASARRFLEVFRFRTGQRGCDELLSQLKGRFVYSLHGEPEGWGDLSDMVRGWISRREGLGPDGRITFELLQEVARWNRPSELDERFRVPEDHVAPDPPFVEALLNQPRRCAVLVGHPGVGKSTLLAHLTERLEGQDPPYPIVRHHYYLPQDEGGDRHDPGAVARVLMQQMSRKVKEQLRELTGENIDPQRLRAWLERVGERLAQNGRELLVIIDGLDHVGRERGTTEPLDSLFSRLLPVPPGVRLIAGTQPVADDFLPRRLLETAPRDEWLEIPLLTGDQVLKWLRKHFTDFRKPQFSSEESYLGDLTDAFLEVTLGNPLHLRYSFEAARATYDVLFGYDVRRLPACPDGQIVRYYESLWSHLREPAREMLHLVTGFSLAWNNQWLESCLAGEGRPLGDLRAAWQQVKHLLRNTPGGQVAFHPSLPDFVRGRRQHDSAVACLRPLVLAWLREKAPPGLRWRWEWVIAADGGDPAPLIDGPTRPSVLDAILAGRSPGAVQAILDRAASEALAAGALAKRTRGHEENTGSGLTYY